MPTTVTDADTAVLRACELLVATTELVTAEVQIGRRDRPRPSSDHVSVISLADNADGMPANLRAQDGSHVERHARQNVLLCTGYGEKGVRAVKTFATRLRGLSAELFAAVDDGLAIRAVGNVRDESQLKTTSTEPRASLQVTVGYVVELAGTAMPTAERVTVGVNGDADVIVEVPDAA